jgi:hypothetical protein
LVVLRELWSGVTALLDDEPTELERKALATTPAGEEAR